MTSVVPPLHRTRFRRTWRTSRPSLVSAASSGSVVSVEGRIPSGIGQTIAHATYGLDQLAGRSELVAQVVDIGIDRVRRHRDAERPGLVEELIARQRLTGMAEETFEERELARTQVDQLSVEGHPPRGLIEHDRPDDEPGLGTPRRLTTPPEGAQPCRELL